MKITDQRLGRMRAGGIAYCCVLAAICGGLAGCATTPSGGHENMGQAIQRMDQSVENTISRLQNKTYDE
ncbi:hypothetical protein BH09VER1_BH09VER1_41390 [soil metagenome]